MQINMQIQDLDRVAKKFEKTGEVLGSQMTIPASQALDMLKKNVPPYPPELPNQIYKRTGILGNSFETQMQPLKRGVTMKFRNTATQRGKKYPAWVISSEKFGNAGPQAKIHRGRWYTMQKYTQSKVTDIVRIFSEWVKLILSQP